MRTTELIRLVWVNMSKNKFRMLLTALGIIVGTVTIILVVAIGQGGEAQAAAQFSGLSADTIYIKANYQVLSAGLKVEDTRELTPLLMEQILEESSALEGMYLRSNTYTLGKIKSKEEYLAVAGVTEDYLNVSNLAIQWGNNFSQEENAIVIGSAIAEKHFASAQAALGNVITLGKINYRIVGVLERSQDGLHGMNPDNTIFMPYATMVINEELTESAYNEMVAKAHGVAMVNLAMREIQSTLHYQLENSAHYSVEDAGSRIEAATASARNMKMLLISVAAIVFLVSGIGIMNVLFVSIKERTKEIGILGALGMRRMDILLQFLLESMGIGIFGGVIGVGISTFVMEVIRRFSDMPMVESIEGKVFALIFAIVTGTVFGFYPACKAAMLKPVAALANE